MLSTLCDCPHDNRQVPTKRPILGAWRSCLPVLPVVDDNQSYQVVVQLLIGDNVSCSGYCLEVGQPVPREAVITYTLTSLVSLLIEELEDLSNHALTDGTRKCLHLPPVQDTAESGV